MFENITSLTIQGGFFDTPTELKLFESRLNVLFGRNGSGKSSIAEALAEYASPINNESQRNYDLEFDQQLPDDNKKKIFVFDEEFTKKKLRIDQEGLDAIVMLGEMGDLQTQIDQKENESKSLEKEITELGSKKSESEELINALFYQIKDDLNSWATTDSKIRGIKRNSSINESTIRNIYDIGAAIEDSETVQSLSDFLKSSLAIYLQSEGGTSIHWKQAEITLPISLDQLIEVINQRVERPELSDRDQIIIEIASGQYSHYENDAKTVFRDSYLHYCPLCLRSIGEDEKSDIIRGIESTLTDKAEIYQKGLADLSNKFGDIPNSIPQLPDSFEKEKNEVEHERGALNSILRRIRELIGQRSENLYSSPDCIVSELNGCDLQNHLNRYNARVQSLSSSVTSYDEMIQERDDKKELLETANSKIAYILYNQVISSYFQAQNNKSLYETQLNQKTNEKARVDNEKQELVQQKKQIKIALDFINQALSYVFFDKNRLQLISGNDCYLLKSHGLSVLPSKVSMGERNIISLCYFFASIFNDKEEDKKYNDESLIIIDDPISSFDRENKLGVMSLLRWQCDKFLKGNANTKVLILTHDLLSAFNMQKIACDMPDIENNSKILYLKNRNIEIQGRGKSEYKRLIMDVFEFAKDPSELSDLSIGNKMRMLIEAYSTFNYNEGIDKILREEKLINKIPEEKREYYRNFMTRLVLNGMSHTEERAYALSNYDEFYTDREKKKTARSLLLFLYYIDEVHLSSYLKEEGVTTVKTWADKNSDEM